MIDLIKQQTLALDALCQRYAVRRLELFGSAASGTFDASRSDLDFIVEFDVNEELDLFNRYFGLSAALQKLFDRKVDLVMIGAMKNPYFIESVNNSRQLVYAA